MAILDPNAVAIQPAPLKYDHLVVNNFAAALNPDTGLKSWAFSCLLANLNADGTYSRPAQPTVAEANCQDAMSMLGTLMADTTAEAGAFAKAMVALDSAIQSAAAAAVNYYRLRNAAGFVALPVLTVQ